jgi:hypothetical protein
MPFRRPSKSRPRPRNFAASRKTGKILKVESVTEGSVVSYEAVIQKGIKKSEVAVNADGTMKKKD